MSVSPRSTLLVLLLLVPLGACGGEDSGGAVVADPSATTAAAGAPTVIEVTVEGGQPSGGAQDVSVDVGDEVTIRVTADVADEVHVHGYDLKTDTVPGQAVEISFAAAIPGQFEVELEDAGVLLVNLTVS
jgi:FtsP/CotA-like multicopper oxidase with cupredoxin domain